MLAKILTYPVESPLKTLAITLLFISIFALGLPKVIIESNLEAMLDQHDPLLHELHAIEAEFTESHAVLIGVVAKDSIFTPSTIRIIQALTEAAWQAPFAYRVDSLSNFQYTQVDGDELNVDDLFPSGIGSNNPAFKHAKKTALSRPEIVSQLVSSDEKMAAIHISFNLENASTYDKDTATILTYINKTLAPIKATNPQVDFIISGKIALDHGIQVYIAKDTATLIPLMLLLMVVILFFLMRSATATLGTIIVVALTGIATIGLAGWFQIPLDAITSLSPIVIMTLAVADAVHINTGAINGLNKGLTKIDALRYSLQQNALPVFLTSLTTVLGVITFIFTDLPTVQNLGIIIAIGVAIAFLLSMTLLPAMLTFLPMKPGQSRWQRLSFIPLANGVIAHYKKILIVLGSLCLGLAALAPQNQLNESPELFFKTWTDEKKSINITNQHMAGVSTIDFVLYAGSAGGVTEPTFLEAIERFNQWLKAQKGVGHVKSIGDTFKQLNKNMHGDDPKWYLPPDSRELAAQYLLLYELSLPMGLDLTNQINLDKSAVRLTITTKHLFAADRQALRYRATGWFTTHYPNIRLVATGRATILEQMTIEQLMPDLLRGGLIALIMVSFILFAVLRNWKLGLIGVLANIIPVMIGYGIWSLIDGVANLAVMSVAGICLGVVVDFAIHFLTQYRSARLKHQSPEDAIRFTFEKIGFPLWTTTIVLVSGFLLLLLSAITLNSSLGALTAMIILITLIFDFVMLPAMLLALDKPQQN